MMEDKDYERLAEIEALLNKAHKLSSKLTFIGPTIALYTNIYASMSIIEKLVRSEDQLRNSDN